MTGPPRAFLGGPGGKNKYYVLVGGGEEVQRPPSPQMRSNYVMTAPLTTPASSGYTSEAPYAVISGPSVIITICRDRVNEVLLAAACPQLKRMCHFAVGLKNFRLKPSK